MKIQPIIGLCSARIIGGRWRMVCKNFMWWGHAVCYVCQGDQDGCGNNPIWTHLNHEFHLLLSRLKPFIDWETKSNDQIASVIPLPVVLITRSEMRWGWGLAADTRRLSGRWFINEATLAPIPLRGGSTLWDITIKRNKQEHSVRSLDKQPFSFVSEGCLLVSPGRYQLLLGAT